MSPTRPRILVFTGVAGCGKTTLGRLVAGHLGRPFYEGDDFHDPVSVAKMRRGEPLDDADRLPWLRRIRDRIESSLAGETGAVFACSALKRAYREILRRPGEPILFVYLAVSPELAAKRLASRKAHFAGPSLAQSQFAALEPPAPGEALCLEASAPPESLFRRVMERIEEER